MLIMAFVVATSSVAVADEEFAHWTHVGDRPVCDSVENAVNALSLPQVVKPELVRRIKATTIEREVLLSAIRDSNAPDDEKRLMAGVVDQTCFKFFGLEYFRGSRKLHPEVMKILEPKVNKALYGLGHLRKGDTYDHILFGSPARLSTKKVLYTDETPGAEGPCPVYIYKVSTEGVEAFASMCVDCDNLGHGWKRGKIEVEGTTSPVTLKSPRDSYTTRIMVWEIIEKANPGELTSFEKEILGKQSRDLGRTVDTEIAKDEKLRRIRPLRGSAGVFDIELHDLNWPAAAGSKVGFNNGFSYNPGKVFPANFGPGNNVVEVPVVDGEGQLTLERKITLEESYQIIRAPADLEVVHPKDKTLNTCVSKTSAKCAGTEMGKWHKEVQKFDWVRYHFFVRKK